jgi:catechol 2,3-dioxygenase-like lactoylglutathione lyase family enzyme
MGLHRLIGMRIGVPDPAGLAGFYGEMGLTDDGSAGFAGTDGGTQVVVEEYDFRRLLEVRIAADDEATVAATAHRLTERGLTPSADDTSLTVVDPATQVTFRVEVAERWEQPAVAGAAVDNRPGNTVRRNARAAGVFGTPRPPRRLGHIVIGTPDLDGTRDFLVDGLGFKISDQADGIIAFLRCSTDHHNVALVGSPAPLLQHYSWECDDVDHVGHAATKLVRADETRHAWGFGRHFVGSNYYWYLRDPSGSFVELYSDMDVIDDDEAWERTGRTEVGFEHVANSWGPNIPAEFIAPADLDELRAAWAGRS